MHFALESKIRLKKASHQRADTRTTFVCFKKRNIATGEKAIALWAEITHPPLNSHFSTWSGMVPGFINSCSQLIHNNEECPIARRWTFLIDPPILLGCNQNPTKSNVWLVFYIDWLRSIVAEKRGVSGWDSIFLAYLTWSICFSSNESHFPLFLFLM